MLFYHWMTKQYITFGQRLVFSGKIEGKELLKKITLM